MLITSLAASTKRCRVNASQLQSRPGPTTVCDTTGVRHALTLPREVQSGWRNTVTACRLQAAQLLGE